VHRRGIKRGNKEIGESTKARKGRALYKKIQKRIAKKPKSHLIVDGIPIEFYKTH